MLPDFADLLSRFMADRGGRPVNLIAPGGMGADEVEALLQVGGVAKICLAQPSADLLQKHPGRVLPYRFGERLALSGPLLLLASRTLLTKWMMQTALLAGQSGVYCIEAGQVVHVPFYRFAVWRVGDHLIERLNTSRQSSLFFRLAQWVYERPRLRGLVRTLLRRPLLTIVATETSPSSVAVVSGTVSVPAELDEATLRRRLSDVLARAAESAKGYHPEPGRVILINAGLGPGGAERQAVNTLLGLKQRGVDVSFVGEYVFGAQELSFYLSVVEDAGIPVQQVPRQFSLTTGDLAAVSPYLVAMDSLLPGYLLEEIANLVLLLRQRRPEVFHAWQDSTSVKAAIAAIIVGVPCILMSSRNVNPSNFGYHQPYMRPAYQALASFPDVVMLNNSEAGVQDYCRWLNLPRDRYALVRNGMNFHRLERATAEEQAAFRLAFGIPADVPLVGSIFRFWPEKRPLLWLECAATLAQEFPDHHFVLAGDGPLKPDMQAYLDSLPAAVAKRFHLIPPQKNIARMLTGLDLFLLVSRFEGTPNVVLEAQWCGAPVVVTAAGGTAEALLPGKTGLVVRQDTVPELVAACREVLTTPAFRAYVAQEGQRFITTRFGFDRMIDETLALYDFASASTDATTDDSADSADEEDSHAAERHLELAG